MSDDIATWLTQIWDEQEAAAKAATEGPWKWQHLLPPNKYGLVGGNGRQLVIPSGMPDIYPSKFDARLIEMNDPTAAPPSWDGRKVEWRGWPEGSTTMVFHSPRERCAACGTSAEPAVNAGIMDAKEGEMVEHEPLKKTKSGRHYRGRTILVPAKRWIRLFAFRCPDCHQDEVWDKEADEWWTLDESDYGSDGSTDPRLF